jgi:hypothetical protein
MQVLPLIWGILAGLGMVVGFFPCLGALNWLNIPFTRVGLIVSVISLTQAPKDGARGGSIAGVVICAIAVVFGGLRLILGGGIV